MHDALVLVSSFFLFKPDYLITFEPIKILYITMQAIIGVTCLALTFYIKKVNINYLLLSLGYIAFLILANALLGKSVSKVILSTADIVIFLLYLNLMLNTGNLKSLLKAWKKLFIVLVMINIITEIVFPQGLTKSALWGNRYYFLDHRNRAPGVCVIMMFFVILFDYISIKRIPIGHSFLLIASALQPLLTESIGCLLSSLGAICFFWYISRKKKRFDLGLLCVFSVAASGVLVFSYSMLNLPFFSNIIINVFNKKTTLSGRTLVWSLVLDVLQKSPLLGNGMEDQVLVAAKIWQPQAHNGWLEFAFLGGIPLLVYMVTISFVAAKRISLIKNKNIYCVIGAIFSFFMIWYLTDAVESSNIVMLFLGTLLLAFSLSDNQLYQKQGIF
jgi:O-antigen ligase